MKGIRELELDSLIFRKILDGILLPKREGITVFDISLSDCVIPQYLVKEYGYEKVFTVSDSSCRIDERVIHVSLRGDLSKAISGYRSDLFLSLGSAVNLVPIFDVVHAINRNLVVGGKFIITVYPDIYDDQGRDILNGLSLISEIPVKEKLVRWYTTFKNALNNFMRVDEDEVLTRIEVRHLIELFGTHLYKNYLFSSDEEWVRFFNPVAHLDLEYNVSWKMLKGFRV